MTSTSVCNDYLDGTVTFVGDTSPIEWTWDMFDVYPLPTMYVSRSVTSVIAPFVKGRFNMFSGHKFRLGGSKK